MSFPLTAEVRSYVPPDPPLKAFTPARDRAFFADPEKKSLLSAATSVDPLTPYIGTELKGVQLSQLTNAQKDELALLVAEVCLAIVHIYITLRISLTEFLQVMKANRCNSVESSSSEDRT